MHFEQVCMYVCKLLLPYIVYRCMSNQLIFLLYHQVAAFISHNNLQARMVGRVDLCMMFQ
jgi:hypothetical protein